jgi:hypothetical protein
MEETNTRQPQSTLFPRKHDVENRKSAFRTGGAGLLSPAVALRRKSTPLRIISHNPTFREMTIWQAVSVHVSHESSSIYLSPISVAS